MNRNNQAEQMKAPGFWYTFLHTIKASFLSRDTILIFAGAIAFYLIFYAWPYGNQQIQHVPSAVLDLDRSAAARRLVTAMDASPAISVVRITQDEGEAMETFRREEFSVLITIPKDFEKSLTRGENVTVQRSAVAGADLAAGSVRVSLELKPEIFYQVLSEQTGLDIGDEAGLMPCIMELARAKRAYEKVRSALEQVEATGYGIVMPSIDELHLEPPEIVHQDGRCGVRLQACAPSIQMMKATIHTELSPIVGTEKQSEDLVQSLLADFADDPVQLWESNIFGKSLHELVNEGLHNKLYRMPVDARLKLQETLERIINEGCGGLICFIL